MREWLARIEFVAKFLLIAVFMFVVCRPDADAIGADEVFIDLSASIFLPGNEDFEPSAELTCIQETAAAESVFNKKGSAEADP